MNTNNNITSTNLNQTEWNQSEMLPESYGGNIMNNNQAAARKAHLHGTHFGGGSSGVMAGAPPNLQGPKGSSIAMHGRLMKIPHLEKPSLGPDATSLLEKTEYVDPFS